MGAVRPRLVLAVLCAAQFLVVLDITVVNVALPAIREDLAIVPGRLHWAISAYAMAFGGLLLLAGRLADLLGRRRVLLAGIALFGAFSLACGLAPDGVMVELLDWRWIFLVNVPVTVAALAWARERRAADPLLPACMLRARAAAAANLAGFLHGAMMLGSFLPLTVHVPPGAA